MTVDTLTLARELRAASFDGPQAEALAAAIGRVAEAAPTTADFSRIEARIDAVLAAVNAQADSLRTEVKAEMSGLRAELKAEMRATVDAVSARIESARSSLLTWIVSVIVAGMGLAIALIKH